MSDPQLPLGQGELWPDRLPVGAGCFKWFLPAVDWPTLHRYMNDPMRCMPSERQRLEEITRSSDMSAAKG